MISDRRKKGDRWVHEVSVRIFPSATALGQSPDAIPFLRLLRSGAQLSTSDGMLLSTADWGEDLTNIGKAVEAIMRVADITHLDLSDFLLADLKIEEFGYSLSLLDAVLVKRTPFQKIMRPVVITSSTEELQHDFPTEEVWMELPVVVNLKNKGIVIWIEARGVAYLSTERYWRGFRVHEQLGLQNEVRERFKKSVYPEIWFIKDWPPLYLGAEQQPSYKFEPENCKHVQLEARISQLASP